MFDDWDDKGSFGSKMSATNSEDWEPRPAVVPIPLPSAVSAPPGLSQSGTLGEYSRGGPTGASLRGGIERAAPGQVQSKGKAKSKGKAIKCSRCQRFGHKSAECRATLRVLEPATQLRLTQFRIVEIGRRPPFSLGQPFVCSLDAAEHIDVLQWWGPGWKRCDLNLI